MSRPQYLCFIAFCLAWVGAVQYLLGAAPALACLAFSCYTLDRTPVGWK